MVKTWYISILLQFQIAGYCGDYRCYEEFRTHDELQCLKIKYDMYRYWKDRQVVSELDGKTYPIIKKLECE